MGGLLLPLHYEDKDYFVLTGTRLTSQFEWTNIYDHPLKHLILDARSIQDASKADWLVKAIAVFQILWLVVNVAVRGTKQLTITQLGIATVDFAVMAILTLLG